MHYPISFSLFPASCFNIQGRIQTHSGNLQSWGKCMAWSPLFLSQHHLTASLPSQLHCSYPPQRQQNPPFQFTSPLYMFMLVCFGWAFWKCLLYIYFIRFACWMVSIYMHRLHPVGTACVRLDSLPCNVVMLLETILLKMQTLRLCVLIGGFSCCYSAVRHWFLTMNVVIIDKCGFFFIAPMVMNTSHKRCF